ncbi:MAG: hypothetical protein AAF772_08690 [Acidobacteriota bacterium]
MTLNVNFRAVGVYCQLDDLVLDGVDVHSTVKDVMDVIVAQGLDFGYTSVVVKDKTTQEEKEIVDTVAYSFSNASKRPDNASMRPHNGYRDLSNQLCGTHPSLVWQYYRSILGTFEGSGKTFEIRLPTKGQPSFATTGVTQGFTAPPGFTLTAVKLTWRILQLQIAPERQLNFMAARMKVLEQLAQQV